MRILRRRRGGDLLSRLGVYRVRGDCLIQESNESQGMLRKVDGCVHGRITSMKYIVQGYSGVDQVVGICLICEGTCIWVRCVKTRVNCIFLAVDLYKTSYILPTYPLIINIPKCYNPPPSLIYHLPLHASPRSTYLR